MKHYSIYGALLGSTTEFPELAEHDGGAPKWTFEVATALEAMRDPVELGAERIYSEVHARLFAHAAGHRVTVDDTGEFDLSRDGRRVVWQERTDAWPDFVRAHLMGRVLATSMFLDGWLPLHGSAVAFRDGVAGFLAPKGYGKSSLALALTHFGGRLVTDDTLPVELTSPPLAWPGVQSMRVHGDAIQALGLPDDGSETREGKKLTTLRDDQLQLEPAPLRAIYLLHPIVAGDGVRAAARERLPEMVGALSVVAHVKIGRMLGSGAARTLLDRASILTSTVPVYRLDITRDLARIEEACRVIAAWHAGDAAAAGITAT